MVDAWVEGKVVVVVVKRKELREERKGQLGRRKEGRRKTHEVERRSWRRRTWKVALPCPSRIERARERPALGS